MKLVVLDGYTLNPGDLSWDPLAALGELTVHDRTPPDQVVKRGRGAGAVFTNKTIVSAEAIAELKDLKYIGVLATGCNVVDLEAAAEREIPVCNVAGYGSASVAQMVFAYILHFSNRAFEHSEGVRAGKWAASDDFSYWDYPLTELAGLNLGIYGLGDIGSRVSEIGKALGMNIIAYTRRPDRSAPEGIRWVGKEELFAGSDILTLHCPLTPETERMINAGSLSLMKDGAILINTGRGPLIDEAAVAKALESGKLSGAGIDVLNQEPPRYNSPLLKAPNCLITPHQAWATRAARQRLLDIAVGNLKAFLDGDFRNKVN